MHALQEELVKKGFLIKTGEGKDAKYENKPEIEALNKLQELQRKVTEEGASGFEKERVKAKDAYETAIDEVEKLASVAGHYFNDSDYSKLKKGLAGAYGQSLTDINFKEQIEKDKQADEAATRQKEALAKSAADQRKQLETEITLKEAQEGKTRGELYEEEYQRRKFLLDQLLYGGELDEKEYTEAVKEETIKRLQSHQKEVEDAIKQQDAIAGIQLAAVQGKVRLIDQNPDLSSDDRRAAKIEALRQENTLLQQNIAIDQKRATDTNLTVDEQISALKRLEEEQQRLAQNEQELSHLARQGTWAGEWGDMLTALRDQWKGWAAETANSFATVWNSAINTVSNGITGLIMHTLTWKQALTQIGTSILTEVVNAIVRMAVQWVASQVLMFSIGKSLAASSLAAAAPIATALASTWAAPAALSTIASYGGAAAAAPVEIGGALAITKGLSLSGFDQGGFTGFGSPGQVAGVVHANEYVFSAPAVSRIGLENLDLLHSGGVAGGQDARAPRPVHVHVWGDSKAEMLAHIRENPDVQHAIVSTVERRGRVAQHRS